MKLSHRISPQRVVRGQLVAEVCTKPHEARLQKLCWEYGVNPRVWQCLGEGWKDR